MHKLLLSLLLLAGVAAPGARAAESYDNCTGFITSIPAVITTQGTWCLSGDLATASSSGFAVTVQANNVTIDCNHFKLGGLAAGPGTLAYGIYATNRVNTTIRNCNLRGFFIGALLVDADGAVVEDSRFDGNFGGAMAMVGQGYVIRRNYISDTGGSTQVNGALGMSVDGSGDILDNTIDLVFGSGGGSVDGILTSDNNSGLIADNRIRNLVPGDGGIAVGIHNNSSGLVSVLRNLVHGNMSGSSVGIRCSTSFGMARDNVIRGFGTPIDSCANAGNNYTAPGLL